MKANLPTAKGSPASTLDAARNPIVEIPRGYPIDGIAQMVAHEAGHILLRHLFMGDPTPAQLIQRELDATERSGRLFRQLNWDPPPHERHVLALGRVVDELLASNKLRFHCQKKRRHRPL